MKPQFLIPTVLSGAVKYLLNDSFNDTLAAGSVNGTAAAPGPGTRSTLDTGSDGVTVSSGNLVFANPDDAWAKHGHALDSVARAAGVILVAEHNAGADATKVSAVYWTDTDDKDPSAAGANRWGIFYTADQIATAEAVATGVPISSLANSASNNLAIILRTSGAYYFVKGDTFAKWTLVWTSSTGSETPLFPTVSNNSSTDRTSSFLRVPEATLLPEPLAYDTFTDDNSTSLDAHASNTTGPDSQGVVSRSWTEQSGDWDIQGNKAECDATFPSEATVDAGEADIVLDCNIDPVNTAGDGGVIVRYSSATAYWWARWKHAATDENQLWENDSGNTKRASAALVPTADGEAYDIRVIADGTTIDVFTNGGTKISYESAALNETATIHGLRGVVNNEEYDNFLIFARDSGYSELDKYTR